MTGRLVFTAIAFCVSFLQACAEPQISAGHEVDPKQDIIIGSEDAANELILYLSPGDIKSVQIMLTRYQSIKDLYVDKNRLRVVFREVPHLIAKLVDPDGGTTRYDAAITYSAMLGVHLRCAYRYHGDEAYVKTWTLVGTSVARAVVKHDREDWPYFDREAMETVFFHMGKDALISRDEFSSCDAQPMKRNIGQQFIRHSEILSSQAFVLQPPLAFLNGEPIEMTRANKFNELMLALKENLDPEYALSGN